MMKLKKKVGKIIATLRAKKGFTQEALAKAINSSIPTIWRWENDESEPRASDIQKLCEVLNVSEAELLNGPRQKEIEIKVTVHQTDDWEEEKIDMTQTGYEISHAHMSPYKVSVTLTLDTEKPWDHEGALHDVLAETERRALIALKAQQDMEKA
jgi:transcriptional regulator with XRE-family HTH domain